MCAGLAGDLNRQIAAAHPAAEARREALVVPFRQARQRFQFGRFMIQGLRFTLDRTSILPDCKAGQGVAEPEMSDDGLLSYGDVESALSIAYVQAIAAQAGYTCGEPPGPDRDSVDIQIGAGGGPCGLSSTYS